MQANLNTVYPTSCTVCGEARERKQLNLLQTLAEGTPGCRKTSCNKFKNLVGSVFGALKVIARVEPVNVARKWLTLCRCGRISSILQNSLVNQGVKHCKSGHHWNTHGLSRHPLYSTWFGIVDRCDNPDNNSYALYGGRPVNPITYDNSWRGNVAKFISDVESAPNLGPRPSRKYTIDRIDVNGGYFLANMRWATAKEQVANRRIIVMIGGKGVTLNDDDDFREWAMARWNLKAA